MTDLEKAAQIMRAYPEATASYTLQQVLEMWKKYSHDDLHEDWAYPDAETVAIVFAYNASPRSE